MTGATGATSAVVVAVVVTVVLAGALITAAVVLWRREGRRGRIRLPARLVSRQWVGPGDMLVVEFPGPDGAPRRTTVFSAWRRGLGATPTFQGWVWVNPADPSDVVVRPNARLFWPVLLSGFAGFVVVGGIIATLVLSMAAAFPD